jgi:hypothetical protein
LAFRWSCPWSGNNPPRYSDPPPRLSLASQILSYLRAPPLGLAPCSSNPRPLFPSRRPPPPRPCPCSHPLLHPDPLSRGERPKCATHYRTPLALWDVYVDDFLGLVQGGARARRRVKCVLLHTLHTILRPLDSDNSVHLQGPAYTKKMAKGESATGTVKVILGWIINTLDNTISLSTHRLARIREILASISTTQRRVSLNKWQQVLSELQYMYLAIHATIGIFFVLEETLKTSDGNRVRLTPHTHAFLQDFHWLAEDVGARPTAIGELVPDEIPSTQGAYNASKKSLGGMHFVPLPNGHLLPLLWRHAWPTLVASKLISTDNPGGGITNSDLELASTIAQFDVLAQAFNVHSHTIHNLSENAATVLAE